MSPRLFWIVAAACAITVAAACFAWIRVNPLPSYWDEAAYANNAIVDRDIGFLRAYNIDTERPPAHRLLALPFTSIFGPKLSLLRSISIVGFMAAAALLAAASSETITFLIAIASPVLVMSTKMFSTEYPLLLAIAGLLFALLRPRVHWSVLGVAIGLGCLSKTSFFVVAIPMLIAALLVERDRRLVIAKGTLLGAAIAATWWIPNGASALRFGIGSGGFSRHSLGSPWSIETLIRWLYEFAHAVMGWGVLAAIILLIASAKVDAPTRRALIIAGSGAALVPLMTYTSSNHNPRLVATTMFLLAAIAGTLAARANATVRGVVILLVVAQIVLMTFPRQWTAADEMRPYIWRGTTEVMAPVEQWDWTPLRVACDRAGLRTPLIAIIGETNQMTPASVLYAWTRAHRNARVLLVTKDARRADVIVTSPLFSGDPRDHQPELNAQNASAAAALSRDPSVAGPVWLNVGLRRPMMIVAFFPRKSQAMLGR